MDYREMMPDLGQEPKKSPEEIEQLRQQAETTILEQQQARQTIEKIIAQVEEHQL